MKNNPEIASELKELSPFLSAFAEKEMLPKVPAGYFESIADSILHKTSILDELKIISVVVTEAKLSEKKPVLPSNYFDYFSEEIFLQTYTQESLIPAAKKLPVAPDGYFESFADALMLKIKSGEINSKQQTKAPSKKQSKIIYLFTRLAIAASLAGVIVFGIKNSRTVTPENNCEDGVACLTQEEIYNYMSAHSQEFDVQQVQETVRPQLQSVEIKTGIEQKEAADYIEQHKSILDVDDASTDIF